MREQFQRAFLSPTTRGVHHLALCTDDMKATIDFYVEVLGMPLVHAMKVPPGLGTGPGNRGNPPYEQVRHYFFDMGNDSLLAFFEIPKGKRAPTAAVAVVTQNAGCLRLAEELGECVAVDQSARYKSTARRFISGASDRGRDGKANFNRDIARHRHPGRGTNGRSTLSHGLRSQFGKGSGALVAGC